MKFHHTLFVLFLNDYSAFTALALPLIVISFKIQPALPNFSVMKRT